MCEIFLLKFNNFHWWPLLNICSALSIYDTSFVHVSLTYVLNYLTCPPATIFMEERFWPQKIRCGILYSVSTSNAFIQIWPNVLVFLPYDAIFCSNSRNGCTFLKQLSGALFSKAQVGTQCQSASYNNYSKYINNYTYH